MKTTILATAVVALLLAAAPGKEPNWTGNFTDKKFLSGKAVFQLNILDEGGKISIDFDAVYNNGHGCAPEGNGPATIMDKDTLKFTFTDTAGNAGSGTIKRAGNDIIISVHATRVADRTCLVFYSDNIHLHPAR
jgi:hypothetical protein